MATTTTTIPRIAERTGGRRLITGGPNTRRREAILGLLFVTPVMIVTLLFQMFPVVYGFYISLQDQKGVLPDGFVGMANFVRAVGSLAYMIPLVVATILLVVSVRLYGKAIESQRAGKGNFRPYLIPGFIVGGATLAFSILAFRLGLEYTILPLITLIVGVGGFYALNAINPKEPAIQTQYMLNGWGIGLFALGAIILVLFTFTELNAALGALLEALPLYVTNPNTRQADYIVPLVPQFLALFGAVAGVGAVLLINAIRDRLDPVERAGQRSMLALLRAILIVLVVGSVVYVLSAQGTLFNTVSQFRAIPNADIRVRTAEIRDQLSSDQRLAFTSSRQLETASRLLSWSELYTMLLGIGIIFLAYYLWDGAKRRETTPGMLLSILVALCLMVGGYFFIGVLPEALAGGDKAYYDSLIRTVTYALLTVPIQLALGLALAYLLFHEVRRGKGLYRLMFFMPYIAPTVATAAVFAMIFSSNPISPANNFVNGLGFAPQEWLQTTKGVFEVIAERIAPGTRLPNFLIGPSLPLLSAILYAIWVFSGYNAVVFMAGLGNVPKEIYEAAQVDGAGRWTTFRRIVFPLISPTTYFLSLLAIIGTFRAFTHLWVLRNDQRGGIDTAMIYIYETIQYPAPPTKTQSYAAALSFLLFGIILLLTIVQNRYSRDRVFYG